MEVVMGTVSLVDEDGHPVGMGKLDNILERADRPEISRVNDKYGFGRRVLTDSLFPVLEGRLVGKSPRRERGS